MLADTILCSCNGLSLASECGSSDQEGEWASWMGALAGSSQRELLSPDRPGQRLTCAVMTRAAQQGSKATKCQE